MSSVVLDASVLIAVIKNEVDEDAILDLLTTAAISTVNLVEVLTKIADLNLSETLMFSI